MTNKRFSRLDCALPEGYYYNTIIEDLEALYVNDSYSIQDTSYISDVRGSYVVLIGAYGDNFAVTPNIDELASYGTIFTNSHVQQAICAPSRVSLLTGLRPDLTEVWDLETQMRDRNPNIITIPQHYKDNGYKTIGMGKIFDNRSRH